MNENKKYTQIYIMTESEREAYLYIKDFCKLHGFSPTISEIATGCGYSITWAKSAIKGLAAKGYINYVPKKMRTITIAK